MTELEQVTAERDAAMLLANQQLRSPGRHRIPSHKLRQIRAAIERTKTDGWGQKLQRFVRGEFLVFLP